MSSQDRLSYLQSNEDQHDNSFASLINPCKSLSEAFNSILEEEVETEHLKVYLRIRPLLSEENITSQDGNIECLNPKSILLTAPSNSHVFKTKPQGITKVAHKFTFTRVYEQDTSQKLLFEETTQDLVKDLVKGENCLLFTYGATNSGKTYTIQGSHSSPGLLPRTLDVLFNAISDQHYAGKDLKPQHFGGVVRLNAKESLREDEIRDGLLKGQAGDRGAASFSRSCSFQSFESGGVSCAVDETTDLSTASQDLSQLSDAPSKIGGGGDDILSPPAGGGSAPSLEEGDAFYGVFVSFAEIYNEYIYDLLDRGSIAHHKKSSLLLGEDRNGATYVKGLREVRVRSASEALAILEVGKSSLHFASTRLNHHSSRSHCIFTLKLIRLADPLHPHVANVSMLSLCDLAGAERSGKTLNSMDRLKEANNINTSLLVLGRCMTALRQNQVMRKQLCGPRKPAPIPYRDSKVTRLFQSFFAGKGKVALVVNISMAAILFDETLKVLKFSALASKVSITHEKAPRVGVGVCSVAAASEEEGGRRRRGSRPGSFSRLVRHSLNMSASSDVGGHRLSAPWTNKSFADVTFGGGDDKENSRMGAVAEEEEEEGEAEEEEEEEEDERYEALLQLIQKLKEKLLSECKEKQELEERLRREICDAFSKRIVQIEDSWKCRLENQRSRADKFMDWRMNHVMQTLKEGGGGRKRMRRDEDGDDDDEEMVPSLLLVREEIKVKDLEREKNELEEELEAVKSSLMGSSQMLKGCQEKSSKLVFQLAHNNELMDKMHKDKEEALKRKQSDGATVDTVEQLITDELRLNVQALEKSVAQKDKELKSVKDMLVEAAQEFLSKEESIASLESSLCCAQEKVSRQAVLLEEAEAQLGEARDTLAARAAYLDDREHEIHRLNEQLTREQANQSTTKTKADSEEDFLRLENIDLDEEITALRREIDDLKRAEGEREDREEMLMEKLKLEVEAKMEDEVYIMALETKMKTSEADRDSYLAKMEERGGEVERLMLRIAELERFFQSKNFKIV